MRRGVLGVRGRCGRRVARRWLNMRVGGGGVGGGVRRGVTACVPLHGSGEGWYSLFILCCLRD